MTADRPPERLLTEAELAALPTELATGTVIYELHRGRLITLPLLDDTHGAVRANLAAALMAQGQIAEHGKAHSGVELGEADTLTADGIIPNFRLPVRDALAE